MVTLPLVDFEKLRITTVTAPDGRLFLFHADVCRALSISNSTTSLDRLLPEERATCREVFGPRGTEKWLISESGFWRLAMSTRTKAAESLKTWLYRDVFPSLRVHGRYELSDTSSPCADMEAMAQRGRVSKEMSKPLPARVGHTFSKGLRKTLRRLDGVPVTRTV